MESLVHADIFFFITTIAVSLLTVGLLIALYYLIVILRRFKLLSDKFEKTIDDTGTYLKDAMTQITESSFFRFIFTKKPKKVRVKKEKV